MTLPVLYLFDFAFFCFCLFPLFSEAGDRPPVLVVANLDTITVTHLNGTMVPNMKSLDTNATQTLDFRHKDESLCWLSSSESEGHLLCASMTKLKGFSETRRIHVGQNLQSKYY